VPGALSHLFTTVGSMDEARRLYVDLLGLEVLMEGDGYVRVGGGDGFHMGIEEAAGRDGPHTEIVVRVDDVDAAVDRLRAAGIEVTDPTDQPWGARHAWLHDGDGRPLSIYSPIDAVG
jgi:catechol 2,3-dioxygenase-like lactoylglutathione lyase family enzyme